MTIINYKKLTIIKAILLITVIFNNIGCKPTIHVYQEKIVYNNDTINLYSSTQHDIDNTFGFSKDSIDWTYSFEKFYKHKAISFSYEQNDSLKIVKWFNANTSKNTILIEGKQLLPKNFIVKDVFEMFGQGEWSYSANFGLKLQYHYFDFKIKICPENRKKLSQFKGGNWIEYYEEFKLNKVLEIEVY
jgi:hypothetical protein